MFKNRTVVVNACCYICEHGFTLSSSDVVLCEKRGPNEQHDYLDVCNRFSLIKNLGPQEDYYDKNI